jgi:hypothetical protein
MTQYTFQETLALFSEKLGTQPPKEDLEKGNVELMIDELHVLLSQGSIEGSLRMQIVLGLMLQPIQEARLKELATSNFLGINTGGCALSLDPAGVCLDLQCHATSGTSPQENWEWLHRIICVAREWNKILTLWDEFVPLNGPREEITHDSISTNKTFRG